MCPDLPYRLRSAAIDFGLQGSQNNCLVSLLREAADELDKKGTGSCAAPGVVPLFDSDGVPRLGPACINCED